VETGLLNHDKAVIGTVEAAALEPHELEEVVHVLDVIDNGRGRDRPKSVTLHLGDTLVGLRLVIADPVSLI